VTVLGGAWHLHCDINQSSLLDASHSTGKGIYIGKGIKLHLHSSISTGKGKTTDFSHGCSPRLNAPWASTTPRLSRSKSSRQLETALSSAKPETRRPTTNNSTKATTNNSSPYSRSPHRLSEWTDANHLRHTKFVVLRNDKEPRKVVRET
jgi:hypothetical protein